ncbi:hypothetical protein HZU75_01815 [Chitinibacter fontanus]|uniref:Uncharacterized protein n=1 Tax=Chitinibacter fontanus TaxID=1737446 RepID=A0A7D5V8A1_9NEIS|nr:hypothetical protein [Chitinibacter fontanus]QLI80372.1 hypothetical protein HZU75_01815 [Chitinibacter fontanus]
MTYRFRVSSVAFAQQKQLQVPMALIEYLAQPAFRGAAPMLSSRMIGRMPLALRSMAQRFIGLYVTADGQGKVTQIGRVTHRLPVSAQADQYGLQLTSDRSVVSIECDWQTPIGA